MKLILFTAVLAAFACWFVIEKVMATIPPEGDIARHYCTTLPPESQSLCWGVITEGASR